MKKFFVFSLIFLLLFTAGCSNQKGDDLDDPIQKVQLTVNVVDALNQSPVEGASILIENLSKTGVINKEGKAVFSLNPGEYIISVSKKDHMNNGSIRVRVDRNTTVTLELGKEINEILDNNTKTISNGFYTLDFKDLTAPELADLAGVELILKKSGLSPSELNKYVKDTEIAGNIILLDLENFKKATTSNGSIPEVNVNLEFKIHNSISRNRENLYNLMAISFYGENNYKVIPLNATFNNGFYNAVLPLRINGANIDKAYVFLYKMGSEELDFNPTVEDAKKLIEDVKKHGINLTEAGKEQAEVISNNFNKSLVPYGMAIAKRFEEVDFTLDIFGVLVDIGPGEYTVYVPELVGTHYNYLSDLISDIIDYLQEEELEDYYDYNEGYNEYLEKMNHDPDSFSYDEYYWQVVHKEKNYYNSVHFACVEYEIIDVINFYDSKKPAWDFTYGPYTVSISHSDDLIVEREVIEEDGLIIDKAVIDLTNIYYNFRKTSKDDPDMEWVFKFKWEGSGEQYQITREEIEYSYGYEYILRRDVFIIPEKGEILIEGTATDSIEYDDEEGNRLPSIGKITLDGSLDMFAENENIISFNGNLKAEELEIDGDLEIIFDFDGDLEIIFKDRNIIKEIVENKSWPLLENFYFNGLFKTNDYRVNGICSIDFVDRIIKTTDGSMKFSLPENMEFVGIYENTTEDYFHLDGKLAIEMDYSNGFIPDFSSDGQFETQEKYLQYKVNITGDLHARNYESSALDLSCSRTGYRELDVQFAYFFPVGNYIEGNINIDNSEELNLKAELTNQDNLLLTFELNSNTEKKIGEISNKLDTKIKFAEIVIDDKTGELRVVFLDETSTSLLP